MFICQNKKCGHVRTALETIYEGRPYGDTTANESMTVWDCQCGDEYTEAIQCPSCKEWQIEGYFDGLCEACQDEHLSVDNILQYIKDNELQQKYFAEYWTGATISESTKHLIGICERDWDFVYKSYYSEQAVKSIQEYIKENLDHFAEWLTKERKQKNADRR